MLTTQPDSRIIMYRSQTKPSKICIMVGMLGPPFNLNTFIHLYPITCFAAIHFEDGFMILRPPISHIKPSVSFAKPAFYFNQSLANNDF
ncbi:hypothetical protein BGS_0654 [Beggiatoa sp. SS]|nr:hypothetical protein BGS_0654 [Beggiatoa sp. SS]